MFDLAIRNVTLVDGTGSRARPGDVGISGDRINVIGSFPEDIEAHTVIDAAGKVLCPGFVDIHTHSDLSLVADGAARALDDMTMGWFGGIPWLWDRFVISDSEDGYGVAKSLEELTGETGADPYELTLQLCEQYGNPLQVVLFYRIEEDVEVFLAHPPAVVGSDGNAIPIHQPEARPHPRSFGTFPRVLGRYTRGKGILRLGEAIRKMSAEPARRLGLSDRGVLREGAIADLVVFDPDTVIDTTGFGQIPAAPISILVVVVSGTVMVDDGVISSDRPGRLLRRAADRAQPAPPFSPIGKG